jgi:hypothetical protein
MAYIINRYDGSRLVVVDDGILDSSIPVGLVGRNYTGWGEVFNENFVFLLENFKGTSPPARALEGQAWYDSNNKVLKAYDGTQWNSIGNAAVSETEPNPTQGGLWLKSTTDQLFVSVGTEWKLVGPEGIDGFGTTRVKSETITDTQNISRPVAITYINGQPISIFSAETFSIPQNLILGFNLIERGLTFRSDAVISGNLKGNADTSSTLKTPRNINGVLFDGSQNIVIKASTTNPLLKGDYIVGSDWDGSITDTWSVDATPESRIGKVVARDANGEFSAERIISNLTGDVIGNVTALSGTSRFNNVDAIRVTAPDFVGNASTATRLRIPRRINTIEFDGTRDITLPVPAETLVGTTLAPNVLSSSLTALGKLLSLSVEDTGISVSNNNAELKLIVNQVTPTIQSINSEFLKIELRSSQEAISDITYLSSRAVSQNGVSGPSLVPDWNKIVPDNLKINLGTPTNQWNTVYSNNFKGRNLEIDTVNSTSGQVTFDGSVLVRNSISSQFIGNLIGDVTGNVTGNVTGAASLNALKAGDIYTGNISWETPGRGLTWSAFTDGASIKFYSTGDTDRDTRLEFNTFNNGNEYFIFTHTFEAGNKINLLRLDPNDNFGNVRLSLFGNMEATGRVLANSFAGVGTELTNLNATNLSTGRVPNQRLTGSYDIGISGNAATVTSITGTQVTSALGYTPVRNTGDTITGDLRIVKQNAWLVLDSPSEGTNGADQAAGISIGESGYKGSASLHLTYTGDGFGHIGMGPVDGSTSIPQFRAMRLYYLNNNVDFYGTITVPTVNATLINGNGAGISNINASNLASGTVPAGRLTGTYNINISGNAATASSATTATNVSGGVVNATSGTFSGRVQQSALGFHASTIANISTRTNSGFFDNPNPTTATGWPVNGSWHHLLSSTHVNDANYYAMQFAADFYRQDLWYRSTAGSGATAWNRVLHSSNFTDYVPTRTGVGASGTWPINVSGNAASVSGITSAQVIAALGYSPANSAGGFINGEQNYQDNILRRPTIIDYSVYHNALGSRSGTVVIDCEQGNYVSVTAVGAINWAFINPPTGPRATGIILELTNGGSFTQNWMSSIRWPSGTAPILSSTGIDVLIFITDDAGANWRGAISMSDSR